MIRRLILALVALLPVAASAQSLSLDLRQASLDAALSQLEKQTGYHFVARFDKPIEERHRDYRCRDASLAAVLADLAAAYRCDFYSADTKNFRVGPAPRPLGRELAVGPFRLLFEPPHPTGEPGVLELPMTFRGTDDLQAESIAGLANMSVVDNFGRSLLPTADVPLRVTRAPRARLNEYQHRLPLALPDGRSTRIRLFKASLVEYRKVTPLRFEFPAAVIPSEPPEAQQSGVECRLVKITGRGHVRWVSSRLRWPTTLDLVGRGVSRAPQPYLVDATGQVFRPSEVQTRYDRSRGEMLELDQTCLFEGGSPPVKVAYELLLREDPSVILPFEVVNLPLASGPTAQAPRSDGPFLDLAGGSLALTLQDASGRPLEGLLSVGLSRSGQRGWSGWRWIETATDPHGRVTLERLQPGVFRVRLLFRLQPSAPPIPATPPATVDLRAGKKTRLAPIRCRPSTAPTKKSAPR